MAMITVRPPRRWRRTARARSGRPRPIIEDEDGGRVFVHGNLAYAWDVGDTAGHRFAAVSLVRIKATP